MMAKATNQWILFTHDGRKLIYLSEAYKTKKQAEQARRKYPEKIRKQIGIGPSSR